MIPNKLKQGQMCRMGRIDDPNVWSAIEFDVEKAKLEESMSLNAIDVVLSLKAASRDGKPIKDEQRMLSVVLSIAVKAIMLF